MTSSASSSFSYDDVRSAVSAAGSDSRVEVNQRALIDKILARYASAGAVYRELLQNSNDAEAQNAEIYIKTSSSSEDSATAAGTVTEVVYRNDGHPFRPQDWARLRKIAEGNPDETKVGAFGVGAYTMFSICEEPLVISGGEAMAFVWRGDALWTKTGPAPTGGGTRDKDGKKWTAFVMPSRDPYPVPDLVEFGQFLCASLTFTKCLRTVKVYTNDTLRLTLSKKEVQPPTVVKPPNISSSSSSSSASTWLRKMMGSDNSANVISSSNGIFTLCNGGSSDSSSDGSAGGGPVTESIIEMSVTLDDKRSSVRARYVSGKAKTKIPADMVKRMERVTKKKPPKEVKVEIFIGASSNSRSTKNSNDAEKITSSFSPLMGSGRVFIGFRTSQTTGLAAHLAAPLIPTVEREAIDFQDPSLKMYNTELLEIAGMLMRLALEHSMQTIGVKWEENKEKRMEEDETYRRMQREEKQKKIPVTTTEVSGTAEDDASATSQKSKGSSRLVGFAKYMAQGMKKKIADVIKTVEDFTSNDEENELLNPSDPRPLSAEERDAILLMRAFCPKPSTPDNLVGTILAEGFSRALQNFSPPVLTRSGIVRGHDARLPSKGMEAFVKDGVIRRVVFQNAVEYHEVIAGCKTLTMDDVVAAFSKGDALEQEDVVRLIKWWTKISSIEPIAANYGQAIKDNVIFLPIDENNAAKDKVTNDAIEVNNLRDIQFYVDRKTFPPELPIPDSVMPSSMQQQISMRVLEHASLCGWFSSLPLDVWAVFISQHPSMVDAKRKDNTVRLCALSVLSRLYDQKQPASAQKEFGTFLAGLFSDQQCIPFEQKEKSAMEMIYADCPSNLYLQSAELSAFDGLGCFHKVSQEVIQAGVSNSFLLALGVRESVAIDFLFSNLDALKWSDNPKPLVAYLQAATLTSDDIIKLRSTQYLPEEKDKTRTYAPSELYLPNEELRIFPFVKFLQWPSADELSEKSREGIFLQRLGCRVDPPLPDVIDFLTNNVKENSELRAKCLNFMCKRLGPGGKYEGASFSKASILPCIRNDPLDSSVGLQKELHRPNECYSDPACLCMGFPVLDPELEEETENLLGSRFGCKIQPPSSLLVRILLNIVSGAKAKLPTLRGKQAAQWCIYLSATFEKIFQYLSTRTNEFDKKSLESLRRTKFIPCKSEDLLEWYKPGDVYFKNSKDDDSALTEILYHVIEFSPFLAAVGVKSEASIPDLFRLVVSSPDVVMEKLGKSEVKYRALLRRIAANPPFKSVRAEIRNSPFLLGYRVKSGETSQSDTPKASTKKNVTYVLTKAEDICIIDNSFFGRMFPVLQAPHESDLEDFYAKIGSTYITKRVEKTFEVMGEKRQKTSLTKDLAERIQERRQLLVSPDITSRPMEANASTILDDKYLDILQVDNVKAVYSLGNSVNKQNVTCCAIALGRKKNALYITEPFDWFDVGSAIGGLILQRCQLEDAFFFGSLLESPLDQLRARGFPVDRIIRPQNPAFSGTAVPETKKPADSGRKTDPNSESSDKDAYVSTLQQMFPDCSESYIRKQLGDNPNLDKVQSVAEELSSGNYPKNDKKVGVADSKNDHQPPPQAGKDPSSDKKVKHRKHKLGAAKGLSRVLSGMRQHAGTIPQQTKAHATSAGPGSLNAPSNDGSTVPPERDALYQKGLNDRLKGSVDSCKKVNSRGVSSPEKMISSIPEGLERGSNGCEVIPSQDIKPFSGPHQTGKTSNGIKVFSSRKIPASEAFLSEQFHAVEIFAGVLQQLCEVYSLDKSTVAIFHDPSGGTIAFNGNKSLHFNFRFFFALHFNPRVAPDSACYSYWYTVMAHELAHNFVSAHNKEHGFYTESYIMLFLPKLTEHLSQNQIK